MLDFMGVFIFADRQYPFGYNDVSFADLPPMCPEGQLYVVNLAEVTDPKLPRRG